MLKGFTRILNLAIFGSKQHIMSKEEHIIRFIVLPALSFGYLFYSLYVILRKGPVKDEIDEQSKHRDYFEERGREVRKFFYGLFS
jgi:hypothetical protein